jgi:hypothetical protein
MDGLARDPNARLSYDLLSGGLIWSDEVPNEPIGDMLMFRYLLKWRTDIILEKVHPDVWQYWSAAKSAFPKWPGFAPCRCTPNSELLDEFAQLSREGNASIDAAMSG